MNSATARQVTKFLLSLVLLGSIGCAPFCLAQSITANASAITSVPAATPLGTVSLDRDRLPIASLPDHWRFHAGDNPAWADPKLDDSGWSLLESDKSWNGQGYEKLTGFAWYRFRVAIPANLDKVSFSLPDFFGIYQVFADGVLVGTNGELPPTEDSFTQSAKDALFTIPSLKVTPSKLDRYSIVAIRVWSNLGDLGGGGPKDGNGLIGESSRLEVQRDLDLAQLHWASTTKQTLAILHTLAFVGAFVLFLLRRREPEYLWFSLMMISYALLEWLQLSMVFHLWRSRPLEIIEDCVSIMGNLSVMAFYIRLFRPRLSWLFTLSWVCMVLSLVTELLPAAVAPFLTVMFRFYTELWLALPIDVWVIVVIFQAAARRSQSSVHPRSQLVDARLLLIPVLLSNADDFIRAFRLFAFEYLHHLIAAPFLHLVKKPFPIEFVDAAEALFLLSVFGILVLRFTRTRSEEERYASEVEGARSVQQFLIPEDLPKIPGLTIESDYRPAREVGGDFFQIIPNPEDDSALILVGDVAGKGMQAGMLATLLVGSMRTAATFTRDPAILLSTLNNRLCGKGNATCLALSIDAEGAATLVNAGHLPPYLNGKELPMEGALPLGTLPGIEFPILHFKINPGDTLTLISDGILEAQTLEGELFGFDRIAEHIRSNPTAASLASAAQKFGHANQADDITVLTIARSAA